MKMTTLDDLEERCRNFGWVTERDGPARVSQQDRSLIVCLSPSHRIVVTTDPARRGFWVVERAPGFQGTTPAAQLERVLRVIELRADPEREHLAWA